VQIVTPDYFATMRMRVVSGAAFTPRTRTAEPVGVLSESVAKRFFAT
jgi:hypothetical protein